MMSPSMTSLAQRQSATVVLPTYNEALNLESLVTELLARPVVAGVVVVDDNSPDGTGQIADRLTLRHRGRVHVLHRQGPRGYSPAARDGMAHAASFGTEFIVQMDADGSHDPVHLEDMLLAAAHADLVIGSRYVRGGSVVNWSWQRRWLSRFANAYVRRVLHLKIRDCTSGFRVWRRVLLERLIGRQRAWSEGYAFLVEMVFLAEREHARMAEIPIAFVERQLGLSKMSWRIIAESAVVPWMLVRHEP
jgi:dolichol-phosphate mannosyltransferase